VRDYPGALNAAVASVMVGLAAPSSGQSFLNLCCGSGTLMIERLEAAPAALVAGIDHSRDAIECARDNLRSAGHFGSAHLLRGDVGAVPMPSASIDEMVADLPYGMLVGAGGGMERVYAAALSEATRLAAPRASFVVITARKRLFESALGRRRKEWDCVRTVPVRLPFQSGYITPTIYSLRRSAYRG
jgi:23S rRNA G2445 N2-methylase RlmL